MDRNEKLAYCAGILDGEGYLGIGKTKTSIGNDCYYAKFTINMKRREPLEVFHELFGLDIKNRKINEKPYFAVQSNSSNLKKILLELIPYIRLKKKQASLLIEYQDTLEDYKDTYLYADGVMKGRRSVEDSVIKNREKIYKEVRRLNSLS